MDGTVRSGAGSRLLEGLGRVRADRDGQSVRRSDRQGASHVGRRARGRRHRERVRPGRERDHRDDDE